MRKHLRLLNLISLLILSSALFAQADSIGVKKTHTYLSLSAGVPVYNKIVYESDRDPKPYEVNSKIKPIYNLSFDIDVKRFSLNFFANYSQNQFKGSSYLLKGYEVNKGQNNWQCRCFEIYQIVKINCLQIGTGAGYNRWYKKNNFAATLNVLTNLKTRVIITSYFVPDSPYNDSDTNKISLKKNYLDPDNTFFSIYGNLKLSYTRILTERMMFYCALNTSYGLIALHNDDNLGYFGGLGYYIKRQSLIYPTLGLRFKLK